MDGNYSHQINLQGERLCLDFVNTVDWRGSDQPIESLNSYEDLLVWSRREGILPEYKFNNLVVKAESSSDAAGAVFERALILREAIYRIFSTIPAGLAADNKDLAIFNDEVSRMLAHSHIIPSAEGFTWAWAGGEYALDELLWHVVRDAADLLTSSEVSRLGKCADEKCGWLFLDTSRNRSRRWCSMKDCGNRAKARRHYQRKQE
ncbi:MAG: CGNR zinc finger domain-containing protein [Anaerolineales bacterium]|nr:CGNR zinc finger domain-containing protein [Anaerolineales bacterium]